MMKMVNTVFENASSLWHRLAKNYLDSNKPSEWQTG